MSHFPEIDPITASETRKIVLCSGKVYYDLLEHRRSENQKDIALVRIEQLYPVPDIEYRSLLQQYPNARQIVWCQEEPKNQGSWHHVQQYLADGIGKDQQLAYVGRQASVAPAVGYLHLHQEQQNALVKEALS